MALRRSKSFSSFASNNIHQIHNHQLTSNSNNIIALLASNNNVIRQATSEIIRYDSDSLSSSTAVNLVVNDYYNTSVMSQQAQAQAHDCAATAAAAIGRVFDQRMALAVNVIDLKQQQRDAELLTAISNLNSTLTSVNNTLRTFSTGLTDINNTLRTFSTGLTDINNTLRTFSTGLTDIKNTLRTFSTGLTDIKQSVDRLYPHHMSVDGSPRGSVSGPG